MNELENGKHGLLYVFIHPTFITDALILWQDNYEPVLTTPGELLSRCFH